MICMGAMHASYILHPMSEGDGHPVLDNAVQGRVCKHEYAHHVVCILFRIGHIYITY